MSVAFDAAGRFVHETGLNRLESIYMDKMVLILTSSADSTCTHAEHDTIMKRVEVSKVFSKSYMSK